MFALFPQMYGKAAQVEVRGPDCKVLAPWD